MFYSKNGFFTENENSSTIIPQNDIKNRLILAKKIPT
jgi:hypothetical protein